MFSFLTFLKRGAGSRSGRRFKKDLQIIQATDLFNEQWYLAAYPDVQKSGMSGAVHYLLHGAAENRKPSPFFDGKKYLECYPDVAQAGINPLVHYLQFGVKEGRFLDGSKTGAVSTDYVNDVVNKLWGGFSGLAVKELEEIGRDLEYTDAERLTANYTLSRWYAALGSWELSRECLARLEKDSAEFFNSKRVQLLLAEAYLNLSNVDSANAVVESALENKLDADFVCAKTNILARELSGNSSKDQERLDTLNLIYEHFGLSKINMIDPEKGFVFGNIGYQSDGCKYQAGPKISVLMPVYNAEAFITVAVHSILGQTWQDLELIAVDDCSTDKSFEILTELAKSDDRLKVFRNEINQGAYPTRNRALSLASGDFITVHDSDDWSHPQMLEIQMGAMMSSPRLKITCSFMGRVRSDLSFILRPQRNNLEYVHRSYPSLLIRRSDLDVLGEWDAVSANADDELLQRARLLWGHNRIKDVMPQVPMSLFLVHEQSLTQQKGTSLNSLTFGIRHEYSRQAKYWREKHQETGNLKHTRTSRKDPFPIPAGLCPKNWPRNDQYDLVIISDLSLLGGTRRCNEAYIKAAIARGMRVGLFHWRRYDLRIVDIADMYTELSYNENVDFLVPEDKVSSKLVLIHHPPILKYEIDAVPDITSERLGVLVNQSPMQCWSESPHYYDEHVVSDLCERLFQQKPVWIPISPRVTRTLRMAGEYPEILPEYWYPPLPYDLASVSPDIPNDLGTERPIVVGRHCRDHWSKWPSDKKPLSQAYLADEAGFSIQFMGGVKTAVKTLGKTPSNWQVKEFDEMPVKEFIKSLDFFVHFTHEDYIEEFGRNVMESMAEGRVVVLSPDFKEIFQEAAVYCEPKDVKTRIQEYWNNPELYSRQAQSGYQYVKENCALSVVEQRLEAFMGMKSKTQDGV
jgi:glycosyltransferase involved in cell wall biosynthesis